MATELEKALKKARYTALPLPRTLAGPTMVYAFQDGQLYVVRNAGSCLSLKSQTDPSVDTVQFTREYKLALSGVAGFVARIFGAGNAKAELEFHAVKSATIQMGGLSHVTIETGAFLDALVQMPVSPCLRDLTDPDHLVIVAALRAQTFEAECRPPAPAREVAAMIPDRLFGKTRERYEGRTAAREETLRRKGAGATPLTLDTPERVGKYLRRRGLTEVAEAVPSLTDTTGAPVSETARLPQTERLLYERVLGTSQMMAVRFLERGARLSRSVGRVRIRDGAGRTLGYGTGTLVSPALLITNNHVLPDAGTARSSWVEFGYQESSPGKLAPAVPFELDPDSFFETNEGLDYSLVALRAAALDGTPREKFGHARLKEEEGKILLGQTLNIIQHPNGEPKQVALRENELLDLLPDFLHYHTDTAPGSSGSLVCSDEWEVVAIHHSGVPEEFPGGGYMAVDGSRWVPSMGEHRLKWKANEGVRVSRILKDLKARVLTPPKRALVDELLAPPPPAPTGDGERASPHSAPPAPAIVSPGGGAVSVQISISVPMVGGLPMVAVTGPAGAPPTATRTPGGVSSTGDLDQTLAV